MIPYLHIGPLTLPTFGLMVALALITAAYILQADFDRRSMKADAFLMITIAGVCGIAGAKLYHLLESPAEFLAAPFPLFFSRYGFAWFGGFIGGFGALLVLGHRAKLPLLEFLDACSPAASFGYAIGRIGCLLSGDGDYGRPTSLPWGMSFPNGVVPAMERVHPTPYLILTGVARFLVEIIRINPRSFLGMSNAQTASVLSILAGAVLLWRIKNQFHALKKEHRIVQHIHSHGDVLQPEYHRATPECPHPERWHMYDSMTAEVEVLDFLKSIVTTLKPELVVETGTFSGLSTLRFAEGLKQNGVGRIITCEWDKEVYEVAKQRFADSGLSKWIELRNESSLEMKVSGRIGLLFCDSAPELR